MTKKDINRIFAILNANYPDTFKGMSDDAYRMKVNLWAKAFQEEPFDLVSAAVMAYISNSTERFAPNIGQIKEQIQRCRPRSATAGTALQKNLRNCPRWCRRWSEVRRISVSGD